MFKGHRVRSRLGSTFHSIAVCGRNQICLYLAWCCAQVVVLGLAIKNRNNETRLTTRVLKQDPNILR